MKISKLVLENFRCFKDLEIEFHPKLTVIVGNNGVGKTSILDGLAQLFGGFLKRLPRVQGIGSSPHDLRIVAAGKLAPAFRCYAEADISYEMEVMHLNSPEEFGEDAFRWSGARLRDQSPATRKAMLNTMRRDNIIGWKQINWFADQLVQAENDDAYYEMPLFAYYGTDRAVFDTPLRRRNFKTEFARFDSLAGALNPTANFKRVFEWIHAKENEEAREQKNRRSFDYSDPELDVVRDAITKFFPEFNNPRTEIRPLRFVIDWSEDGKTLPFDLNQLSDGYRTTLALVADLASRMVEANPPSKVRINPLETQAVVMIDEVDLHLHPAWQQEILPKLCSVFKNTQFIVTTHSPQVLTTVEAKSIREIVWHDGRVNISIPEFALGAESPVLLQTIQGVNPRPQNIEIVQKLNRYLKLVGLDQWSSTEGLKLREELDSWGKGFDTSLTKVDMDIRLREFRKVRHEKN